MSDNTKTILKYLYIALSILAFAMWQDSHNKLKDRDSNISKLKTELEEARTKQRVEHKFEEVEVDRDCDEYIEKNTENICKDYSTDYCTENYKEYEKDAYLIDLENRPENEYGLR